MNTDQLIADVLYGGDVTNEGLKAFAQAVARGRMDEHEARRILEHSPRLADMLFQGLGGVYGDVAPAKFIELARDGKINGGVLSRAMT